MVRLLIDTSFPVVAPQAECPGASHGSTTERPPIWKVGAEPQGLGTAPRSPWMTSSVVTPSASLS